MKVGISDVRAVLPDRVIEGATVVADDGVIIDVGTGPAPPGALDGRGALLVPGLVDLHCDGLERELAPRPGVTFPLPFALRSFEARLRSAGITTVFHGVAFADHPPHDRSIELAERCIDAIDEARSRAIVDHQVLHRLDARSPDGLDPFLARLPASGAPLVSVEDNASMRDVGDDDERSEDRERTRSALAELASCGRITLFAHDPEGTEDIDDAWRRGAAVAEFPVSVEAARAAHRKHMAVVMGAPNVLRGGSHAGGTAAAPLIRAGLCDVLASDYLPTSLLAAAFAVAMPGGVPLPTAIGLVTCRPAAVAGLHDRGRLEIGRRADLVLIDDRSAVLPRVVQSWRAEDEWPAGVVT